MSLTNRDDRRVLFEQFLRCLDREENLIHYRLTWGIQWNAAIAAAVFGTGTLHLPVEITGAIHMLLASLGVLSGWLSYVGVNAAFQQSNDLIKELGIRLGIKTEEDWRKSEFIRPYGKPGTVHLPARKAAMRFPWLFIGVWSIFLLYSLLKFLNATHVLSHLP